MKNYKIIRVASMVRVGIFVAVCLLVDSSSVRAALNIGEFRINYVFHC